MKKKILTLSLVVALAATALIGGTLAYFTDNDEATNVFTVGKVDIELDETEWDKNTDQEKVIVPGKEIVKDPVVTVADDSQDCYLILEMDLNKYVSLINLMGVDAYINNIGGLEGTYPGFTVFVKDLAENTALRAEVVGRWFHGINHADWMIMNMDEIEALVSSVALGNNAKELCIKLGYQKDGGVLSAKDAVQFMTAFEMPKTVTHSMMNGDDAYYVKGASKSNFNTEAADFKITFTAHAIQAEEIGSLQAAYDALFK